MKSSIFLTAASAALALAGPVVKRDEVVVTDIYTVIVTVTEWDDYASSTTSVPAATYFVNGGDHPTTTSTSTSTSSTSTTTSSTSTPQVVYVTYEAEPTTSTAEPVVYTTSAEEDVTSTAQAATASPTDLISAALYNHNVHRANHSASDVTWLDEIADYAQTTANTCVFAHDMDEGSGDYGQNIAMYATSSNAAAIGEAGAIGMASDMWYNNEVNSFLSSYYGEATPDMSNFEAFGHFTQMVWKNTQTIGCAVKLCAPGTMYSDMSAWYMVCNYRPAGNVGGQYGTNVLKSLGEATYTS